MHWSWGQHCDTVIWWFTAIYVHPNCAYRHKLARQPRCWGPGSKLSHRSREAISILKMTNICRVKLPKVIKKQTKCIELCQGLLPWRWWLVPFASHPPSPPWCARMWGTTWTLLLNSYTDTIRSTITQDNITYSNLVWYDMIYNISYHIILYYIMLYYIVLYYIISYYSILYYIILYYIILYYIM